MAGLRDSNGTIVIYEHEANQDIQYIDEAKTKLAEARKLLDPNKLADDRMLGATRDALAELLGKICKDLSDREAKCNDTRNFIRTVIEHYQRTDREYSNRIRGR